MRRSGDFTLHAGGPEIVAESIMIANATNFASTMLRIGLVSLFFVGPVAGFAAHQAEANKAGMKGAGLVIFVSLQRNR